MSARFQTLSRDQAPQIRAPDGSSVTVLLATGRGSMACFRLAAGEVSQAVVHRSVEELWFVTAGGGRMWRADAEGEAVTELQPGTCLSLPVGTRFQFRAADDAPLEAVAVTMPPWPGPDEAVAVDGPWSPRV